jgi:hypothetical protein
VEMTARALVPLVGDCLKAAHGACAGYRRGARNEAMMRTT